MFLAYVVRVEPNAADDPAGAVMRAAQRLATTCERNTYECETVRSAAATAYRIGEIGFGLATGDGQLIYVEGDRKQGGTRGGGSITELISGSGDAGSSDWLGGERSGPVWGVGAISQDDADNGEASTACR